MSGKDYFVENKVYYSDSILFKFNLQGSKLLDNIHEGHELKANTPVSWYEIPPEIHEYKCKGDIRVEEGADVRIGDLLCTYKSFFRKKEIVSEVNGVVERIEDKVIFIKEFIESEKKAPLVPFDATIVTIDDDFILLRFSGTIINLFGVKGQSVLGDLEYISSSELQSKEASHFSLKDKIVVLDSAHQQSYPMLSTIGAKGIITNSLDYNLYNDIIILAVPIGIISGFGALTEDDVLVKYLEDKKGVKVWFDCGYNRLIIPDKEKPAWIENYKFDLKKVGIVKNED